MGILKAVSLGETSLYGKPYGCKPQAQDIRTTLVNSSSKVYIQSIETTKMTFKNMYTNIRSTLIEDSL